MKDDFQVMPPLSKTEYENLKEDIAKNGVLVPIEYDDLGNVLDGHHRLSICEELGITEWPRLIRKGLTHEQKIAHALTLNLARRHLTREQREQFWISMRQSGMSYRQIADADGAVSNQTVMRTVSIAPNGAVALPPVVTGKDGKKRQAVKPRTVFVSADAAKAAIAALNGFAL